MVMNKCCSKASANMTKYKFMCISDTSGVMTLPNWSKHVTIIALKDHTAEGMMASNPDSCACGPSGLH